MAETLKTYNPRDVAVQYTHPLIGTVEWTGFADADITIARVDSAIWKTKVGFKGEVSRAKNANKLGRITLPTQQGSPRLRDYDIVKESDIPGSIQVIDRNTGGVKATASVCWPAEEPEETLGAETGVVNCIFEGEELAKFH
jgi:hypothetical protein